VSAVFLVIGLAVILGLFLQLGSATVLATMAAVGWPGLALPLFYGTHQVLRAVALASALPRRLGLGLWRLVLIRLSGEAAQYLTFTGPFLAEPTKAWLLRKQGLKTSEAVASTLSEYLVYTLLAAGLTLSGLLYLRASASLPAGVRVSVGIAVWALILFLLTSLVAIVGRFYLLGAIVGWAARWPPVARKLRFDPRWMREMEDFLLLNLRDDRGRLLRLVGVEALAHGLILVELYWILRLLGLESPWGSALVLEAVVKLSGFAFFFVPGRVGVEETMAAATFATLSLSAATGFSVSLLRRLRSLLAAAAGLAALCALKGRGDG
jgi:hypothetical protein